MYVFEVFSQLKLLGILLYQSQKKKKAFALFETLLTDRKSHERSVNLDQQIKYYAHLKMPLAKLSPKYE